MRRVATIYRGLATGGHDALSTSSNAQAIGAPRWHRVPTSAGGPRPVRAPIREVFETPRTLPPHSHRQGRGVPTVSLGSPKGPNSQAFRTTDTTLRELLDKVVSKHLQWRNDGFDSTDSR